LEPDLLLSGGDTAIIPEDLDARSIPRGIIFPVVQVFYFDHLLFKNTNHLVMAPVLRETVGFLAKENDQAIWVLWDTSMKPQLSEKTTLESGLVILKSTIVSLKRLGQSSTDFKFSSSLTQKASMRRRGEKLNEKKETQTQHD